MYDDMPDKTTINKWRYKHPEFSTQYAQAKISQIETLVDEIIDIADDSTRDEIINDQENTQIVTKVTVVIKLT